MNQPATLEIDDDPGRGTGRTTALMLQAIATAILDPGKPAIFRDHWQPCSAERLDIYRWALESHLRSLELSGMIVVPRPIDGSIRITYCPHLRVVRKRDDDCESDQPARILAIVWWLALFAAIVGPLTFLWLQK